MNTIYTKRLILRQFKASDAEAMFENWTYDERVAKYCRWYPHKDVDTTKALLDIYFDENPEYRWAITLKGNDEPIGAIDVVDICDDNKTAKMGYVLSYRYWNSGIVTEALNSVIDKLFSMNFTKIIAEHHVENIGSGRVMEKCGMKYTHKDKAQEKFGSDKLCDVLCYETIKT